MTHTPDVIPTELAWLFWDVDPATIDFERHRDYVFERVMIHGDWFATRWLIGRTQPSDLAEFLQKRGYLLSPRDRAFWSLIAGVPYHATPGGGRPVWAG